MRVLTSAALALSLFMSLGTNAARGKEWRVYFGTYTAGKSKGIYLSRFDSKNGLLSEPQLAAETKNPSFLALHPNEETLYAVGETAMMGRKPTGSISAFRVDRGTGMLTLINRQSTLGPGPCHVSVDSAGKCALSANYAGGSVCILPVSADGALLPGSMIQHEGSSVNTKRQAGPHAHQAVLSPDERFALVCDLGLDKVLVYALDKEAATLRPHSLPGLALPPGSGPRHLAFSENGKFLYVINELNSTMCVFAWDPAKGAGNLVQTISTVPEGAPQENYCGEVLVRGRYVYGSNRGHDSVVAFKADPKTGRLSLNSHVSSGGKWPRFIGIDPTGEWLISMNQNSGEVVVLKIDARTGNLESPVSRITLDSPVCAVFAR